MTPEDVKLFNHNVNVNNHNAEFFENITGTLMEQNNAIVGILGEYKWIDFIKWLIILLVFSLFVIELQNLENKVKKLERGDKVDKC